MPWRIVKTKKGAKLVNKITGKVKSHHASTGKAKAALRAIYANWTPKTPAEGAVKVSDIRRKKS
jgi:hypothetical protein